MQNEQQQRSDLAIEREQSFVRLLSMVRHEDRAAVLATLAAAVKNA